MSGFDRQEADARLSHDPREADEERLAALDRAEEMAPAPCHLCGGRGYIGQDSFGVYDRCPACESAREEQQA